MSARQDVEVGYIESKHRSLPDGACDHQVTRHFLHPFHAQRLAANLLDGEAAFKQGFAHIGLAMGVAAMYADCRAHG